VFGLFDSVHTTIYYDENIYDKMSPCFFPLIKTSINSEVYEPHSDYQGMMADRFRFQYVVYNSRYPHIKHFQTIFSSCRSGTPIWKFTKNVLWGKWGKEFMQKLWKWEILGLGKCFMTDRLFCQFWKQLWAYIEDKIHYIGDLSLWYSKIVLNIKMMY